MAQAGTHNQYAKLHGASMPTEGTIIKPPGFTEGVDAFGDTVPPDGLDGYPPGTTFTHYDATDPVDMHHTNYGSSTACQFLPSACGGLMRSIDETVDLTDAGAKYVSMTNAVPTGAVIVSVQANIETLAVAGGTTVKIGIGANAGDVDAYGKTTALTKNLKINTIPDWAVLAADTTLDVCGIVTDGSALGNTNLSAGSVRVVIRYLIPTSLPNAT